MTNFNIKNVGLTNSYQTAEFDPAGWKELGRTTLSPPTTTFEDDFSGSDSWTDRGTTIAVSISNDRIDWDVGNGAGTNHDGTWYDLGAGVVNTTKWVLTAKIHVADWTANSASSCHIGVGLTDTNNVAYTTSQDSISLAIGVGNNDNRIYGHHSDLQEALDAQRDIFTITPSSTFASATSVWLKLVRNGSNTMIASLYSDEAMTTLLEEKTTTMAGTPANLRYIMVNGRQQNVNAMDGYVDDIKFYNGVTDVSGASDNILVSSLADKKYYMALASTEGGGSTTRSQSQVQMGSPPATATTPTYTGWAVSGGTTYHSMDSANSEIDFNADRNTAGDRGISKSVGTLNSDTWVARFQLDIDTINKPDGGGLYETFSLNAVDSSVVEQSGNTFIGLALQSSSTEAYFKAVHGVNTGNHSNQVTIGSNGSFVTGTYYVEITRLSATSATVKVFDSTGSDYSTGQIGSTATLNLGSSHTTDLQYFTSKTNSGGADNNYVLGSFKGLKIYDGVTSLGGVDTGSNYAGRFSNNSNSGVADTPLTSDTDISISDTNYTNAFEVGYIANQASEEKLGMFWNVLQSTALASNAPNRTESVGKWSHTTSVLDRINWFNRQTGDFAGGSELVILGWDPTDNQSENFWEELASVKLGSAGDTLDSGTFTAKKYLWFQVYTEGANTETQFRLNNDSSGIDGSSGKYASRRNNDGGSDSTFTNQTQSKINSTGGASHTATFMNGFIINNLANEKLIITNQVAVEQTGTGTAPRRSEGVTKWENTSAQVTSIQAFNNSSGDFGTESFIKVWGHN